MEQNNYSGGFKEKRSQNDIGSYTFWDIIFYFVTIKKNQENFNKNC